MLRTGSRVLLPAAPDEDIPEQHGTLLRKTGDAVWLVDIDVADRQPDDIDGMVEVSEDDLRAVMPAVGDPATICYPNDRYPATVVAVLQGCRVLVAQQDREVYVRGSALDGSAEYVYERNPNGYTTTWSMRKNGRYHKVGEAIGDGPTLAVGYRRYYQAPEI